MTTQLLVIVVSVIAGKIAYGFLVFFGPIVLSVVWVSAYQQGLLEALKSASFKASNGLKASCSGQIPQTIADRLGVIDARTGAMLQAIKTVRPALESFYASLDDEQKAKFNTMGYPLSEAARGR